MQCCLVHGLQEVLANEENKIDHAFKLSMSIDIAAVSKHQAKRSNKNLRWLNEWTMFDQTSHKESLRFRENVVGLPVLDEPGFVPAPGAFWLVGYDDLERAWPSGWNLSWSQLYYFSFNFSWEKVNTHRGELCNVPYLVCLILPARLPRLVIRPFCQTRSLVPG